MLIGLLGLLASSASRALSDTLTFSVDLAVNTNMLQFVYGTTVSKRRDVGSVWRKWGPFVIILVATIGSMADITKQVLLDSAHISLKGANATSEFNFGSCSYTATATPLPAATAPCAAAPMTVMQQSAVGPALQQWLRSSSCESLCNLLGWMGVVFTVGGFMWLSDVVPWLQQKWRSCVNGQLEEKLLGSDHEIVGCKDCQCA